MRYERRPEQGLHDPAGWARVDLEERVVRLRVAAHEIDRHVRESLEQRPTVGLEQDRTGLWEQLDPLDLFVQPGFEATWQRRIKRLVVVVDGRKIVFHPGVENKYPRIHARRAASRAFSPSQVSPIDESA